MTPIEPQTAGIRPTLPPDPPATTGSSLHRGVGPDIASNCCRIRGWRGMVLAQISRGEGGRIELPYSVRGWERTEHRGRGGGRRSSRQSSRHCRRPRGVLLLPRVAPVRLGWGVAVGRTGERRRSLLVWSLPPL